MRHVVGGVAISIEGDFPPTNATATSEDFPDIGLRLSAVPSRPPYRLPVPPSVEQDSWVGFVDGDTLSLCIKDRESEPYERMRIELPRNGLEGRYLYDDGWPYPFCYPMDQLLVVHALGVAGGVLMHGATIRGRDGVFLVAGPSGAGKTTMSRAAAALGACVLSDERSTLRPRAGGGWLAGGTPWPGEGGFADNSSGPLRGLILIEQADRDELTALTPGRALALLYRCHFPPLWDPVAAERTLNNLERLVHEVPAFAFRNQKGPAAARLLLDRLGGTL